MNSTAIYIDSDCVGHIHNDASYGDKNYMHIITMFTIHNAATYDGNDYILS